MKHMTNEQLAKRIEEERKISAISGKYNPRLNALTLEQRRRKELSMSLTFNR